jgi:peptidoglycan/LPS O-acetylase OafA/YrhL
MDPMTTNRALLSNENTSDFVPGPGRHLTALDGLRGLAVLFLLIFHIFQVEAEPAAGLARIAYKSTRICQTGVDLFFVLSGFLITGILHDTKGSRGYFRNFFGRRTVRIFPLYYGVLVVATILLPAILGHRVTDASPLAMWTYTANIPPTFHHEPKTFGHFWTLAVEEQFYLIWPAVVFVCSRTMLMRVCVGCIVGSIFVRLGLVSLGLSTNFLSLGRLDSLALGGLLAVAARGAGGMAGWRPRAVQALAAMIVLIAPLYVMKTGSHEAWLQVIKYTFLAGMYGAVLVLALLSPPETVTGRFFHLRVLRFLGKYSYGIYVFHPLLIDMFVSLRGHDASGALETPLAVALRALAIATLSILAAWLSYHLYEKHFLNLKRFFAYGPRRVEEDREPTPEAPAHPTPGRGFAVDL